MSLVEPTSLQETATALEQVVAVAVPQLQHLQHHLRQLQVNT